MTGREESQHSLLWEEDLVNARPRNSWHPLGHSSTPAPEYTSLPNYRYQRFSREGVREVGLGISDNDPYYRSPRGRQDSDSSTAFSPQTPGFLKTPQTPGVVYSPTSCPTSSTVLQRRFGWVPVTIFVLAVWATALSGLYLAVAFWKPRWTTVGTGCKVALSTATFLSSFFAKTIEMTLVTICVAFLGQVLSRRALTENSRGVSISDMSMRAWIMQPGSMIVHWETLRHSGLSFLGLVALTASLVAMLYTTAADALVSPKLSMSPMETRTLWGKVSASFANSVYLGATCETPVSVSVDPTDRNSTCLQLTHVGTAYHDYKQWISNWAEIVDSGHTATDTLRTRLKPVASMGDNITVQGSWIEIEDMEKSSKKYGRMVSNITMAMPHGGIPGAAKDPKNHIQQPDEASGEGKYNLEASVPSPAVNVLCVGMTREELAPLIYSEWPDAQFDPTTYYKAPPENIPKHASELNRTVVDPLFLFGEKYGQRAPIFGKFPEQYNTIVNATGAWPANAAYLIGKPDVANPPYVMCALRAKETGVCSTSHKAASSGALLSSNCEDGSNKLQFNKSHPKFVEGIWDPDWKNIAREWLNSLSLGTGITDGYASNSRLLMQLMPAYNASTDTYFLDPKLPSISEALAVMAGSTLLLSSRDAPYVQGWNYTGPEPMLSTPAYQNFRANLQVSNYASGGVEPWQSAFYAVLILAFVISAVCLAFIIFEARGHQITDFTEPQNLFALAVNSPQSSRLEGACGGGPAGNQLKERWYIGMEENDAHYYIRAKMDEAASPYPRAMSSATEYAPLRPEPMGFEDGGNVSPAVNDFRRVSKRSSFFTRFY